MVKELSNKHLFDLEERSFSAKTLVLAIVLDGNFNPDALLCIHSVA